MLGSFAFLLCASAIGLALTIGGLWVVRKYVDLRTLTTHHDVAGYMLTIIGTLYAVVLGLMVVGSLTKFQTARANADTEANTVHDIFHLAQGLPKNLQKKLRTDCRDYASVIVKEEWPAMEHCGESENAHLIMTDFWKIITEMKPADSGETNVQASLLQQVDQLGDCRNSRLLTAKVTFDPYIWGAIIGGGFILIIFTYFFGVEKFAVQALMTGLLTIVLAINLMIIALYDAPYSGDVKVSSQAYSTVLGRLEEETRKLGY